MECFRLLFDHLAWIEHQFLSGIRDSRKAGSLWGMMRDVGGVRKSIHQSWLAEVFGLRLGLLCLVLRESKKRFRRKRPALFKSAQWHFSRTMHQSTTPSLSQTIWSRWASRQFVPSYSPDLASCDFSLFPKLRGCCYETIEEMKVAVTMVIDTLTQRLPWGLQKLLERYKCIAAGEDYFEWDLSFMCVQSIKVPIQKKFGNLFNARHICQHIHCVQHLQVTLLYYKKSYF